MLPNDAVLGRLIKANVSFLLYGQKASGKTSKIIKLLEDNRAKYILINCTLANKKSNFLRLFNVELNKYLSRAMEYQGNFKDPSNLDSWITEVKKKVNESPNHQKFTQALDNLIIFMDNIEEMEMSENFISAFYTASQKQFNFKFSFIFCGINFKKKQYCLQLPFRTMISFCMPKPESEYEELIRQTVQKSLKEHFKQKISYQDLQRSAKLLTTHIKASFDNIEFNLDKIKSISKAIIDGIVNSIDQRDIYKSVLKMANCEDLKSVIKQVREFGPLQEDMMKRKALAIDSEQIYDLNTNLQYYPNLILTSIHLADYYAEKQDKRRFQDYKNRTNARNKDLKRNEFKIGRHNMHRIIAIADSLQSQGKNNDKEKILEHHSLDFYSQFQHLKKINRIRYNNNKITGVVKQEQSKAFINKMELSYNQFMG